MGVVLISGHGLNFFAYYHYYNPTILEILDPPLIMKEKRLSQKPRYTPAATLCMLGQKLTGIIIIIIIVGA